SFKAVQSKMLDILKSEGIDFKAIHVDRSFEHENKPTRKPGIGMFTAYLNGEYDLANSYVIGDRITDVKLAMNLKSKAIFIKNYDEPKGYEQNIALTASNWDEVYNFLKLPPRKI